MTRGIVEAAMIRRAGANDAVIGMAEDAGCNPEELAGLVVDAITLPQVTITVEIIDAYTTASRAWSLTDDTTHNGGRRAGLAAAFRAAGFEVSE